MTGRARGRSRARSRSAQAEPAARPGMPPSSGETAQAAPQQVARGRGRAPTQVAAAPQAAATPQVVKPQSELAGLSEQMSAVQVAPPGEQRPQRFVGDDSLVTKPENVTDLIGSFGAKINLRANFFKLVEKSTFSGFFQYNVSYNPPIESKNLKFMLLKQHAEVLGSVRAFDGLILFLPKRLPELETKLISTRKYDESQVEITIKLTNEVPFGSQTTLQLLNIIFRRYFFLAFLQCFPTYIGQIA